MKKISVDSENLKFITRKLELHATHLIRVASEKIHNPKRIGLYFATIALGLSASRFVSSIIVYMLATELQGIANPAASALLDNQPRKESTSVNIDLSTIIDGVFFKRPSVETKASAGNAPSQNFSLIGTLEGDPAYARAVIRILGVQEEPKEYALGEKIGNATLIAINFEKIWVRENGVKFKIEVGENAQDAQNKANTSTTTDGGVVSKVITRQEINDKILGDPSAIYGGGAAFGPNLEEGKVNGFKLHRIPENHIFYTLGARSGDIIKSVNGYTLTNTQQMMELWNNIKTMPRVSVDLVRDGKPLKFNFEVRN